ncbi:MAG: class I SAM-dependent methyltransferase [Alphaproteobacteria bacterium]|jgi:ubiquinone/menaquinone biosynthesis C-methylase UbiE|nr:class I SAM-dependent methyltransferase [Alphaproteobacteria bacterium]MBP7729759.1 class I SAM-dependent methyltransferase [Alphaproteobacteria bacterium]
MTETKKEKRKTMNNMGSMFFKSDPALTAFLGHVERTKGYFADIGAAYGHSTFEALKCGGHVMAIDLEQGHLDELLHLCPASCQSRLEIQCGHFPNTLTLPDNTFEGILLSRVLIFLTPSEISLALVKLYRVLKPGGGVYIASPSSLRQEWKPLKVLYEQQKLEGLSWPGRVENLWELISEKKAYLPNVIQLIDTESLRRGLLHAGFNIDQCDYYPKTLPLDKDSFNLTYAVASKQL